MKKIVIIAALLAMTSAASFAAMPVNLEVVGILGGHPAIIENGKYGPVPVLGPLAASAVSLGLTNDISVALGVISVAMDKEYAETTGAGTKNNSVLGVYLNGYYRIMSMGAINHYVGLELGLFSTSAQHPITGDMEPIAAQTWNIMWRTSAKVFGEVKLLFDLELLSIAMASYNDEPTGSVTTALETVKVGFSVPLINI